MLGFKSVKKGRDIRFGCSFAESLLRYSCRVYVLLRGVLMIYLPQPVRLCPAVRPQRGGLCGNPISLNKEERGLCPQLIKGI